MKTKQKNNCRLVRSASRFEETGFLTDFDKMTAATSNFRYVSDSRRSL